MDKSDFELIESEESDGGLIYTVRIPAANLSVKYRIDSTSGHVTLHSEPRKIIIGGHDMTSIIGKRFREWYLAFGKQPS